MRKNIDDASLESGFQKIAIYAEAENVPRHVARQLPNGDWTSKIGQYEDIQHRTLDALTGDAPAYGTIVQLMKKAIYSGSQLCEVQPDPPKSPFKRGT